MTLTDYQGAVILPSRPDFSVFMELPQIPELVLVLSKLQDLVLILTKLRDLVVSMELMVDKVVCETGIR
ncbi:MAG: hypothetical protein WBV73_00510 [Phormidium sp.]